MNPDTKEYFLLHLLALSFAFMNAFVRLSGDLPSVQKSFFRNLVAFFIAADHDHKKQGWIQNRKRKSEIYDSACDIRYGGNLV